MVGVWVYGCVCVCGCVVVWVCGGVGVWWCGCVVGVGGCVGVVCASDIRYTFDTSSLFLCLSSNLYVTVSFMDQDAEKSVSITPFITHGTGANRRQGVDVQG